MSLDLDINTPLAVVRELPTLSLDSDLVSFLKLLKEEISVPKKLSVLNISQPKIFLELGKDLSSEKFKVTKREIPTLSLGSDSISFYILSDLSIQTLRGILISIALGLGKYSSSGSESEKSMGSGSGLENSLKSINSSSGSGFEKSKEIIDSKILTSDIL